MSDWSLVGVSSLMTSLIWVRLESDRCQIGHVASITCQIGHLPSDSRRHIGQVPEIWHEESVRCQLSDVRSYSCQICKVESDGRYQIG